MYRYRPQPIPLSFAFILAGPMAIALATAIHVLLGAVVVIACLLGFVITGSKASAHPVAGVYIVAGCLVLLATFFSCWFALSWLSLLGDDGACLGGTQ